MKPRDLASRALQAMLTCHTAKAWRQGFLSKRSFTEADKPLLTYLKPGTEQTKPFTGFCRQQLDKGTKK